MAYPLHMEAFQDFVRELIHCVSVVELRALQKSWYRTLRADRKIKRGYYQLSS